MKHEARYFEILDDGRVMCNLCPVGCKLTEGKTGVCMGRYNENGRMVVTNYGQIVSAHVDPIEKKPLYHFHPGDPILSVGPNGCNLACEYCQNWSISQVEQRTDYVSPEDLVELAVAKDSRGIAYTYTEPLIWFEYLLDVCRLAHENGLYNVCVSNGYINPEPLREIVGLIDAINIDIKAMNPDFYKFVCKGKMEFVLNSVKTCVESGIHVEVTNLIITDLNDSEDDITELVVWIANMRKDIPLHISRYFPAHKMDKPATSMEILQRAYDIGREHLDYVYVGNAHLEGASDTRCPSCGNLLIQRTGYSTRIVGLVDSKCAECGKEINVVH